MGKVTTQQAVDSLLALKAHAEVWVWDGNAVVGLFDHDDGDQHDFLLIVDDQVEQEELRRLAGRYLTGQAGYKIDVITEAYQSGDDRKIGIKADGSSGFTAVLYIDEDGNPTEHDDLCEYSAAKVKQHVKAYSDTPLTHFFS